MNPVLYALFNGLGNIYHAVLDNHGLLELVLLILFYFVFKDVVKFGVYCHRKGWFKRSEYDKK